MGQPSKQVALVTGASRARGIGAAIARALAQEGMDLFITYFRPYDRESGLAGQADEPGRLLHEIQALGVQAAELEIDLADSTTPRRLFAQVEETLGPVTILVNNAAHSQSGGIEQLTAAQLDQHYAVNIRAMALLCAEFVQRFKRIPEAAKYGRIINLSSGQSRGPMPGELAYAASKGAVEAFTVSLSAEVAPLGITVNAIDPGVTDTGWISAAQRAEWQLAAPLGRLGRPEDAARLVRFLASAESGWITGQVIHSHGGF